VPDRAPSGAGDGQDGVDRRRGRPPAVGPSPRAGAAARGARTWASASFSLKW